MELQLICHGTMLFWYRNPSAPGCFDDGYTILIPSLPMDDETQKQRRDREQKYEMHERTHEYDGSTDYPDPDGCPQPPCQEYPHPTELMHEVRLGLGPGAVKSVLSYCMNPIGTQCFDLTFGCAQTERPRQKKTDRCELLLYKAGQNAAVPDIAPHPEAGVAYAIEIPYPLREEPVRIAEYNCDVYTGDATRMFCIHPRRIVASRVLTYEVSDHTQGIFLRDKDNPDDTRVILSGSDMLKLSRVRLHLYCQPPKPPMPNEDHLKLLTGMLRVNGGNLDVKLKYPKPKAHIDPDGLPVPSGLGLKDVLHLAELRAWYPEYQPPGSDPGAFEIKGPINLLSLEPAECGQGGGC